MLDCVKLENGLRIYLVNDNSKHSTYINLIVKFGGIDSSISLGNKKINIKNGTAHFLEHLLLECSKYGDLMSIFESDGIISNGLTSLDRTQFYIDTVKENINEDLKILIDGIHNPIVNKKNIDKIKGPIIEEKNRSLDKKYSNLYNLSIQTMLNNNKFKSILGDIKDISCINEIDLNNAFNAYYRPDNEIIVIGGRFNKEEVINTIREVYSKIKFSNLSVKKINTSTKKLDDKLFIIKDDINIEKSVISFKISIDNLNSNERILLDNYCYYFLRSNFGVTSKLNQYLKQNDIIFGNISFDTSLLDNSYIIRIESYTRNIEDFNSIIIDYLLNNKYIFDEELFNLYKKNSIIDYITRSDNIYNIIDPLIENIVSYNYEKIDEISDIENLSFKEYKKTISNIDFSTYSICVIKRK